MLQIQSRKPFTAYRFPTSTKQNYISYLNAQLGGRSEEEIRLYRLFIEELCAQDDISALECKGYGCYGGDEAFACDWFTSRDCMLRLLRVNTDEKRKAVYANTLGYIYYYGRCNNKVPEYDKAFQMYSMGAAGGMIESMYKLADMYMGGKGVEQNKSAGENIIRWIYNHHYKDFLQGSGIKIADLALRLGSIEAEKGNDWLSLYYLTQADYAIRKRLPKAHYGDEKVFQSIQTELENARNVPFYKGGRRGISGDRPIALGSAFRDDYIVKISLKDLKNSVKITAIRRSRPSQWAPELIEIAFPEHGYYNLLSKVSEKASGHVEYYTASGEPEFYADEMKYNSEIGILTFFLLGEVAATIKADKYSFKLRQPLYEEDVDIRQDKE